MKQFMILLTIVMPAHTAFGQCPNGACLPPGRQEPPPHGRGSEELCVPSSASGREFPHGWYDGGQGKLNLFWKGDLAGTLDPFTSDWRTNGKEYTVNLREAFALSTGQCGQTADEPACPCPDGPCRCVDCACATSNAIEARSGNFGVDWSRMRKGGRETFRIAGAEVPQRAAYAALTGGDAKVPDDAKMSRLVVVGSAAGRRQVLEDWSSASALAAFKDKVIVQAYPADHWHVAEVGYKQFGDPTIYLVDAKGKVASIQKDYEGGPQRLARTVAEGLRSTDPNFDPSRSPDLSRPITPAPGPTPAASPGITPNQAGVGGLAALAAIVGVLFYRKKRIS